MNYAYGTSGNDTVEGGNGSDFIIGGEGFDVLWGGDGKDVFVIHHNDPNQGYLTKSFIYDFQDGLDLVDLSQTGMTGFDQLWADQHGEDEFVDSPTVENMWTDPTWFSPESPFRIYLMSYESHNPPYDQSKWVYISYDDFIYADTPQNWHSDGDDRVSFSGSSVYSVDYGMGGIDTVDLSGNSARREGVTVDLQMGRVVDDEVHHIFEFENVIGSNGQDTITGDGGANFLSGRAQADLIHGGGGDDVIRGGSGADFLYGGAGNDRILGGNGRDMLYGGAGDDVFVFATEDRCDMVRDFEIGDRFDVSAWGVTSFDELTITQKNRLTATVSDGEHSFNIRCDDVGFNCDVISESDFIFAA